MPSVQSSEPFSLPRQKNSLGLFFLGIVKVLQYDPTKREVEKVTS